MIIAIDGPAGSGKSTTAKLVARELGYIYIDTGAMYRAVALAWHRTGTEMTEMNICPLMEDIEISFRQTSEGLRTILNDEDVSEEIRTPLISNYSSPVSAFACVRERLVEIQRKMGEAGGVVMDGRDIGTVVFPNAGLKIFMVATIEARAKRRMLEFRSKNIEINEEEIRKDLSQRDLQDSSREHSPLRKAKDAIEIDTSNLSIEEQTEVIVKLAREILSGRGIV